MQLHSFSGGGAVAHKLIDGRVSAWWDSGGNLVDCERRDGAGRSRKPNIQTVEYLRSIGQSMVAKAALTKSDAGHPDKGVCFGPAVRQQRHIGVSTNCQMKCEHR